MQRKNQSLYFGDAATYWTIPIELTNFQSYGLWNSIAAFDTVGKLIEIIPAHDGDFFPESPLDYVELLRDSITSGKGANYNFWPLQVDIDITQNCNANCSFCYSRDYSSNSLYAGAEISATEFEEIIKELAKGGTKAVRFTGGGEPLSHPEIKKIIQIPRKYGLRSCIITNGELIDKELCELIVSNIDHLRVSINAAQANTRELLHRSNTNANSLSEIFERIEYISCIRNRLWSNQKKPSIWTTVLLVPENVNEIFAVAQIVRDCGADSISFRRVYHERLQLFSNGDLIILNKQLELALSLNSPPTFQVFTPKRDITNAWYIPPNSLFSRCISCHIRTVIEATNLGPMIKICGLNRGIGIYGERNGLLGESLGVINSKTKFSDLWNIRSTKVALDNRPERCVQNCSILSFNITLNKIWKLLVNDPQAIFKKSFHRTCNI